MTGILLDVFILMKDRRKAVQCACSTIFTLNKNLSHSDFNI